MDDFKGRTAVITGGASGIGLAVATGLAAEGMNLVLADIEEGPLSNTVADIEANGTSVIGVRTDVSKRDDVLALAAAAKERFGNVHVLFNNAGVGGGGGVADPDNLDMWEWVIGVDLFGVLYGIKAFASDMIAHGEPCHIVNTASMAGLLPFPGMGAYNVAKYSVVAMSEVLSLETAPTTNLGVSVLCPGFVATNIADSDRNMPENLVSRDEATAEQEMMQGMIRELISQGMPPAEVAAQVVESIRTGRFYILPHPEFHDRIEARTSSIIAGDAPIVSAL
ncbi:MAG: SDR family NAD(P)-dependent oxidoreductase [Acidimicrobiia bacterium]|nr:SDR family NAD(P)-dependent oxidoreductase [Acidimicrobiia bacterium]